MATTGDESSMEKDISCVKYTLFSFNVVGFLIAVALFALTVWLKAEAGFDEWLTLLNAQIFYIGDYILIVVSIVAIAVAFLGCASSLMENTLGLLIYIGIQIVSFLALMAGSALLLNYSTMQSSLQPILQTAISGYISTSEAPKSQFVLSMIQDNLGCCGATGPWDYWNVHMPLPSSCRDAISGNAFFNGCVDVITWFFESKTGWIVGLALGLGLLSLITAVLSLILIQAVKKEEEEARNYKR